MLSRWGKYWLVIVAVAAALTNGLAVAAPTTIQAAPGSLFHALTIICSPQGQQHEGAHDDGSHSDAACEHCALCPISVASLAVATSGFAGPLSTVSLVTAVVGQDAPRADTISHRPSGRGPPVFLR